MTMQPGNCIVLATVSLQSPDINVKPKTCMHKWSIVPSGSDLYDLDQPLID